MTDKKKVVVGVSLRAEIVPQLDQLALAAGLTRAALVAAIIDEYVPRMKEVRPRLEFIEQPPAAAVKLRTGAGTPFEQMGGR